jgi:hypothetical protein
LGFCRIKKINDYYGEITIANLFNSIGGYVFHFWIVGRVAFFMLMISENDAIIHRVVKWEVSEWLIVNRSIESVGSPVHIQPDSFVIGNFLDCHRYFIWSHGLPQSEWSVHVNDVS